MASPSCQVEAAERQPGGDEGQGVWQPEAPRAHADAGGDEQQQQDLDLDVMQHGAPVICVGLGLATCRPMF